MTTHRFQGVQGTLNPLLRLKVALVQNGAAFRYQIWYGSVDGALTLPIAWMDCVAPPNCDAPPEFCATPSRMTVPPAHFSPSPNAVTKGKDPWKYKHAESGIPIP
jgi:hypothetical protein